MAVLTNHVSRDPASCLSVCCIGRTSCEVPESAKTPLADHTICCIVGKAESAAGAAGLEYDWVNETV